MNLEELREMARKKFEDPLLKLAEALGVDLVIYDEITPGAPVVSEGAVYRIGAKPDEEKPLLTFSMTWDPPEIQLTYQDGTTKKMPIYEGAKEIVSLIKREGGKVRDFKYALDQLSVIEDFSADEDLLEP
jgi:DNA-binding Lrp family transcriptional regulator